MNTCPPCNHHCRQGRDCPANRAPVQAQRHSQVHLHTRNGGAQVDTRSPQGDLPIVDLGDELFRADSCIGICVRAGIFSACFLGAMALGCWWLRVPAWLWS